MKWNEIPKFREYGITDLNNFGFLYYVEWIENEIKKYNLEMQPDFQRQHVWTEEQQIAYVEFILQGGRSGRDFYFNWNRKNDEYVCVDGLQCTTALQRFVNGEIKVFGQYFNDFGFTNMVAKFNPLPEFKLNVYINYLESKREILEWYIAMNSGGTPHTEEEIQKVRDMIMHL